MREDRTQIAVYSGHLKSDTTAFGRMQPILESPLSVSVAQMLMQRRGAGKALLGQTQDLCFRPGAKTS